MSVNCRTDPNPSSYSLALSEVSQVLYVIERSKSISLPKLAARTKISTEELDTVLKNLSDEGLISVHKDELGFSRIALVEKAWHRGEVL